MKAVHLSDLPRLMVPPNQRYATGVLELQTDQQRDGLATAVSAVDEVT